MKPRTLRPRPDTRSMFQVSSAPLPVSRASASFEVPPEDLDAAVRLATGKPPFTQVTISKPPADSIQKWRNLALRRLSSAAVAQKSRKRRERLPFPHLSGSPCLSACAKPSRNHPAEAEIRPPSSFAPARSSIARRLADESVAALSRALTVDCQRTSASAGATAKLTGDSPL